MLEKKLINNKFPTVKKWRKLITKIFFTGSILNALRLDKTSSPSLQLYVHHKHPTIKFVVRHGTIIHSCANKKLLLPGLCITHITLLIRVHSKYRSISCTGLTFCANFLLWMRKLHNVPNNGKSNAPFLSHVSWLRTRLCNWNTDRFFQQEFAWPSSWPMQWRTVGSFESFPTKTVVGTQLRAIVCRPTMAQVLFYVRALFGSGQQLFEWRMFTGISRNYIKTSFATFTKSGRLFQNCWCGGCIALLHRGEQFFRCVEQKELVTDHISLLLCELQYGTFVLTKRTNGLTLSQFFSSIALCLTNELALLRFNLNGWTVSVHY